MCVCVCVCVYLAAVYMMLLRLKSFSVCRLKINDLSNNDDFS